MSEINELIIKRLQAYPPDVSALAIEAVRLAGSLDEVSVSERLHGLARELVHSRKNNDST